MGSICDIKEEISGGEEYFPVSFFMFQFDLDIDITKGGPERGMPDNNTKRDCVKG